MPIAIIMIDHLPGHATIDADILAGDKSCLVRAQEQHHIGNIQGIANSARGMLSGIRTLVDRVIRVDPSGRHRVYPNLSRQAHGHGMGQSSNSALGCRIAFTLRLAHAIPGRRNIHDAGTFRVIGQEQLAQTERRTDPHPKGVVKFLPGAIMDAPEIRLCIVNEAIYPAVICNDLLRETDQCLLIANVTDKIRVIQQINGTDLGAGLPKLLADTLSNASGTAGNHHNFIPKHDYLPPFL